MEHTSLKKLEKRLRLIFLALALVTIVGLILLIRQGDETPITIGPTVEPDAEEYEKGLSDSTYWMPQYCDLYDVIPEITFVDEEENQYSIADWRGKNTVVTFWASWCGDCKEQMSKMADYMELANGYGDISFLFINKTDGEKETMETAVSYLQELRLEGESYFDTSLHAHQTLGIKNIPTTLFLDPEGCIGAWSYQQITERGVFEALLKNILEGSATSTADFIENQMMDDLGGIHSLYEPGQTVREDTEVLSESQGLMMLYATETKNHMLFDRVLDYVKNCMWEDGLITWKTEDGKTSEVNALIDDLRIYRALKRAEEIWGGYAKEIASCEEMFFTYGIASEQFVDFYDLANKEFASRFTLCYADFEAMEMLTKQDAAFAAAYKNAEGILEKGQISNEFPLYYSWYNYKRKRYEKDDLNAAEAMMTLFHLAKADKLKRNSIQWLKTQMEGEGIKARYTINGEVVSGYNYESTAVYAIVAMIADEIGDHKLRGQAFKKMEKMRISNTALEYNGAFGMEDGSGITSFDQLMSLLAYCY